jgi:hypothetical protein
VVKYTAILACGNYHGVVGYAKAKGPAIPIALQKVSLFFWCYSFYYEFIWIIFVYILLYNFVLFHIFLICLPTY